MEDAGKDGSIDEEAYAAHEGEPRRLDQSAHDQTFAGQPSGGMRGRFYLSSSDRIDNRGAFLTTVGARITLEPP